MATTPANTPDNPILPGQRIAPLDDSGLFINAWYQPFVSVFSAIAKLNATVFASEPQAYDCLAYNSVDQLIPTGVPTVLKLDTDAYSDGSIHVGAVNATDFLISVTGIYNIQATLAFVPNTTGTKRILSVQRSAGGAPYTFLIPNIEDVRAPLSAGLSAFIVIAAPALLNAGDKLQFVGLHDAAVDIDAFHQNTWAAVTLLRRTA